MSTTSPINDSKNTLTKNYSNIKDQNAIEKLIKQLQTMRVEIDIRRAEPIELIQAVDGKQDEKLEKCLHAILTHANHWGWIDYGKYFIFKSPAQKKWKRSITLKTIELLFTKTLHNT